MAKIEAGEGAVVIAGAGPVGLSLALALARHGVRTVVLEKKRELSRHSKTLGVLTRTLEIFRSWGVLERFLAEGRLLERNDLYSAEDNTHPDKFLDSCRSVTPGFLGTPIS